MDDVDAVRRVIGRFARAFGEADTETLIDLWDMDYPTPAYQPEETLEPFLTPEGVKGYLERVPKMIRGVSDIRPIDFRVDVLDGFAHAYARAYVTLNFVRGDSLSGEIRQSFVLRKGGDDWRLIHYHESRVTPGLEEVAG